MKILVDENMPYARELFSRLGEVKAVPGRPIPVAELDDADALMVRSVTKVNESLLGGKPVKFVGTATAGTDHVDDAWLAQAGIGFSAAPGCNAIAVVEYVFSALLMLAERDGFSLRDRTVGIVGVGNVGGRLQARLEALGIRTLLCDPPRADRGDEGNFCSLPGMPLEKLAKGPEFRDKFTKKFNAEIQLYAPYVYDAVMVMADSMKRADSVEPAKFLPAIGQTRYDGVTALIEFDSVGDLKGGAISIYQYKSGKLEYVETLGGSAVDSAKAEVKEAVAEVKEAAQAVAGAATAVGKEVAAEAKDVAKSAAEAGKDAVKAGAEAVKNAAEATKAAVEKK